SIAAGLETFSVHPLALAVTDGAKQRGVAPAAASDMQAIHGRGIRGRLDGQPVEIGNAAMFSEAGIAVDAPILAEVERLEHAGRSTMVVRCGERFLGVLGVADAPRPEARAALA